MSKQRIWIVNAALCALLVWGFTKLRNDFNTFGASHQVSQLQKGSDPIALKASAEAQPAVPEPAGAWTEIATKSPFSFDRNDISLDLTEAVPPPVSGPKPVLFGTLLLGKGERLAIMGKPGASNRSGLPVKIGETFEGWQVVEIQDKSVVVTSNGAKESLVVGRTPVERSSEKTSSPAASPVATTVAPPSAPSQSGGPTFGVAIKPTQPLVAPPGSHVVHTPWGDKLEKDQ